MSQDLFQGTRNFCALPELYSSFESSQVAILPVPYDSTVDWRAGTREGPQAIIDASRYLELYDPETDREPYLMGIHTLPEIQRHMGGPEHMIERVCQAADYLIQNGKFAVMLGGEHSITVGMIRAFAERLDGLSVLQFDAHADLRDVYLGTKYNHACVARRITELCPLSQVGVRSLSREEHQFIQQTGRELFSARALASQPADQDRLLSSLSDRVYITIDLDALDPSIMSAVGTPEPGGMSWEEMLSILRLVASEKEIVGFDLVELCPREGPASCSFIAAKLAYKLMDYAIPDR